MFDWWMYVFWFFCVFAIVFVLRSVYLRRKKPKIEFKCLEHMVPLDNWDRVNGYWTCSSSEPCEVVVDAETRYLYEGVKPPR